MRGSERPWRRSFPPRSGRRGRLLLSYGALKSIEVSIEGKKLFVTTESSDEVGDELILDTNKRFRNFLERATGYTAKQRLQQAKKEASKG